MSRKRGGGGNSSTGTTITGSVSTPTGSVASLSQPHEWNPLRWLASLFIGESYAQAVTLVGAGVPVLVYEINDLGQPLPLGNPTVLAQTTTTGSGTFTLTNVPRTGVNVIVAAGPSAPQQVCAPGAPGCTVPNPAVYCPAVNTQLNIDAATTFATQQLVATLPVGGTLLGNFTQAEVNTFIAVVVGQAQTVVGTSIADVIAQLVTNSGPGTPINDLLVQLTQPGPPPAQTLVSGSYRVTSLDSRMSSQNGQLEREVETGIVTFNNAAGTFSFSGSSVGGQADASCSVICQIAHTISPVSRSDSDSGTFLVLAGNRVAASSSSGGVTFLTMNPTGTIGFFTNNESQFSSVSMDLGVVVKEGSGLSTASLQGAVNAKDFFADLSPQSGNGSWLGPLSVSIGESAVVFTGSNLAGSFTESKMAQNVACTLGPAGCTLSATLSATPNTDPLFTGTFTVGSNGAITVTTPPDSPTSGWLSADANLAVFSEAKQASTSLTLGVKQGAGMSSASLNGTYKYAQLGDQFETQNATMNVFISTGDVTFSGAGTYTNNSVDSTSTRTEDCSGTSPCGFTLTSTSSTSTNLGVYTVSSTGLVTIDVNITGWVSPDGSVVVFTEQTDNVVAGVGTRSSRAIGIALKQ